MKYLAIFVFLYSLTASAIFYDYDRQELAIQNILAQKNSGFESGKANWTASGGTLTTVTTGSSNLLTGTNSGTWDSNGAAQTLTSSAITIPKGLYGRNGLLMCKILVPSGTATHTIAAYDGTNTLVSDTITSSTSPTYTTLNFIFPSSGTVAVRFTSVASDEPLIAIDDCYIGDAINLGSVVQATFIGSAYFATTASCTFAVTSTTLAALSDTDCPGPTVESNPGPGTIQTTDANAPAVTVNNLPPGRYLVIFTGHSFVATSSQTSGLAISDGTTQSGQQGANDIVTGASSFAVHGTFSYTTTANRTFQLFAASAANEFRIPNNAGTERTYFQIYRFPNDAQQALGIDSTPWYVDAIITGANPSLGTSAVTSYTEIIDAGLTMTPTSGSQPVGIMCSTTNAATAPTTSTSTCAAGSESLGGNFNIPRSGTYEVCIYGAYQTQVDTGEGAQVTFQIIETPTNAQTLTLEGGSKVQVGHTAETIATGTDAVDTDNFSTCSMFYWTSAGTKGVRLMMEQAVTNTPDTSVVLADAGANNGQRNVHITVKPVTAALPAPLLLNSVINSANSVTRVEAARLNCDSGSSIIAQQGSWITSIGNVSAGACAVTITSGIFSAAPYCTVTNETGASSDPQVIGLTTAPTSTALSVDCADNAGTDCTAYDFEVICVGAK